MEDLEKGQPETCQPEFCADRECLCGKLGIQLAGDASYFGKTVKKPTIGDALRPVKPEDIRCANVLLYRMAFLGMAVCLSLLYFL